MSEKRPNIILIYTDQQRYDTLGANGNPYIKTPHLDKLASDGVNFSHSFVTTPLCTPSRIAMFTGRYNHANTCVDNSVMMPEREADFASILRRNGYKTALFGKNHCFDSERLQQAFEVTRLAGHLGFAQPADETEKRINQYRRANKINIPYASDPFAPEDNVTGKVFQWAAQFIKDTAASEQPFFVWLSVPDPHPPYMVSEPYASMYDDVELPLPVWQEEEMLNKPYRQRAAVEWGAYRRDYPAASDWRKLKGIYYGMISYIDDEVGKLMSLLEQKGLDEDTIVIFTSDHGDYLGDHRLVRKGPHLYDALTRVPLIIRWKNRLRAKQTEAMVCNLDLFPTLFDLIDVRLPEWPGVNIHGKSFAGVLTDDGQSHRDKVFLEHGSAGQPLQPGDLPPDKEAALRASRTYHFSDELMRGRTKAVRTKDWKYVFTPGEQDELYDLANDPNELSNLACHPEWQATKTEARAALLQWLIETE